MVETTWLIIGGITFLIFILVMLKRPRHEGKIALIRARAEAKQIQAGLRRTIDTKKMFAVGLLSIAMLYAASLIITTILGIPSVKIGYALMLLIVGGIVFGAYKLLFAQERIALEKKDYVTMIVVAVILLTLMFALPNLVPEMFSVAALELKTITMSMIGF